MSTEPETANKNNCRPDFVPRAMDIVAAQHYTSLGRNVLYQAVADGKLKLGKYGSKTIFLREYLDEFLDREVKISKTKPRGGNPAAMREREAAMAAAASEAA